MLLEILVIFAPFLLPNVTDHALCFAPFVFDELLVEKCKTRKYNYASKFGFILPITPPCKWYKNTLELNSTCYAGMVIFIDLYVFYDW
jgi:hypothetical protein